MARLNVPAHPIDRFTRYKDTLVAEASDLGRGFMSRIFDDACDIGFEIRGEKHTVLFTHSADVRDEEGDLLKMEFTPAWPSD